MGHASNGADERNLAKVLPAPKAVQYFEMVASAVFGRSLRIRGWPVIAGGLVDRIDICLENERCPFFILQNSKTEKNKIYRSFVYLFYKKLFTN